MKDRDVALRALLEAHEKIIVEREEMKEMSSDSEFTEGHINGLNEGRNRIEEIIVEMQQR